MAEIRITSLFMALYKPIIWFVVFLVGLLWSYSFEGKPSKTEPVSMLTEEIKKDKLVAFPEKKM